MSRSFARPKDWHALFLGMFAQKYLQPMKGESLSERRSVITKTAAESDRARGWIAMIHQRTQQSCKLPQA